MVTDRQKLYHGSKDFFDRDGNAVMKLSREAAVAVCLNAVRRGLLILKIEGGIWAEGTFEAGTFEARLDAIWDGADPPVAEIEASENNRAAADFIRSQPRSHNAFIITALSFIEASSTADGAPPPAPVR
jgi:hypothetical protein